MALPKRDRDLLFHFTDAGSMGIAAMLKHHHFEGI
jgi:hypothetical protein